MSYVTIYNTTSSWEISIIKNLFIEHGIDFVFPEEVTSSAGGFASLGMSGIRVQVPQNKREEAIGILKERGFF